MLIDSRKRHTYFSPFILFLMIFSYVPPPKIFLYYFPFASFFVCVCMCVFCVGMCIYVDVPVLVYVCYVEIRLQPQLLVLRSWFPYFWDKLMIFLPHSPTYWHDRCESPGPAGTPSSDHGRKIEFPVYFQGLVGSIRTLTHHFHRERQFLQNRQFSWPTAHPVPI